MVDVQVADESALVHEAPQHQLRRLRVDPRAALEHQRFVAAVQSVQHMREDLQQLPSFRRPAAQPLQLEQRYLHRLRVISPSLAHALELLLALEQIQQ